MTTTETKPRRPHTPARSRRLPWWITLPAALAMTMVLVLIAGQLRLLPGLDDLFGSETKDRSGPAVLKSLRDMSRYEGAAGSYQVVVDLEKDAKFLPDAIRGTRTLFVGSGTVTAYVDLGALEEDNVRVDKDRTTATLTLPHARLAKATLDPDRSYTVSKQRGLLDRLGDLFSDNPAGEQAVNKLAVRHIGDAAEDSGLTARAERNTTGMLEGLLTSLGFEKVTVRYK
ncbi:DUF4230 domain-containing protein [Streptomyces sp. TRM66268-LWL]|uniref:DUF4230 domain-containing protein n=1 Tax=Streptomyces polyasparticus TaxID=2767826 RepID=A0ABR7SMP3_9ACTN|nr:DUF4230 domain-containing protein [Streptomyces polyasparticus]MBC9716750.1 DUF4230 domain-containing protein [Streptomyces polyasparticus]